MINIIYKIQTVNDGEQDKDNNNDNVIKYLEYNKDNLLDLAEKNYENLVDALTDDFISSVAASCASNSALSLPQSSSSMFPNQPNHTDIYGIEQPGIYHNSKDDIDD